ncbi:MAG: hypothetical protein U0Y96_07295 [Candidatus Kapaibacterium sp.]|nr:hypothetical protein [Bacteroidota bacterium]
MQETPEIYAVYVMANSIMTFHVGTTYNLQLMVVSHKENADPNAFTSRYQLHNLVYYELYSSQHSARNRETKLKSLPKNEMIELIKKMNPEMTCIFQKYLVGETPQVLNKELSGKKSTRRRKSYPAAHVYSLRSLAKSGGDD